jgi:drug/metabolite transporter (DMT)-like permease
MSWPPPYVFGAIACVAMIGGGQLLFKIAADQIKGPGLQISTYGLAVLALALAVYAAATLAWVLVLRQAPLSRVYPFMALAFVLVPLASRFFLGETLAPQYWLGVAFLFVGLILISRSAGA